MTYAIILAGGSGTRLKGATTPKQFMEIEGMTILERVTSVFSLHSSIDQLIIVVPETMIEITRQLFKKSEKPLKIIAGGKTRQESSLIAIRAIEAIASDNDIILIHDAARVLVSSDIIDRAIEAMDHYDAASAALPAKDTLMRKDDKDYLISIIDREQALVIQTPQAFRFKTIKTGHLENMNSKVTDDISLVLGRVNVGYFLGSPLNFKVTTEDDVTLLKALIAYGK